MNRYYNDPFGQRRTRQRPQGPTLEDFRALQERFEKLRAEYERQSAELTEAEQQLQIKSEALHKQSEDMKELDAELVWTRAALQQQETEHQEEEETSAEVDWADRYARLQAELENLRKRWEQRFAAETTEARHRILLDMLPLADHLEMALKHADSQDGQTDEGFVENIRATHKAFLDSLQRYGVTPIEAKGQPFDPNLHEAVGQIPSDDVPEGMVAEVAQTGYSEGDKLLRPSRVLVSAGSQD